MKPLHCLIVDDEPLSQDVLMNYIMEIPGLEIDGICRNAFEALEEIRKNHIDLIFLDINMPKLSGISMVKSLENPPMIIFTTAYPEYALEGFEVDALDYLVKPISFDRFLKAVNKARDQFEMKQQLNRSMDSSGEIYLNIKADKKIYRINEKEIRYIQSIGDYIKVYTNEKVIIAAETLKNMVDQLSDGFIRIHKSYIVPLSEIKYLEGNQVRVGNQLLPVGQTYKEILLDKLKAGNI